MRNMKRNFAVLAATVMAVCSIALTGCQQKLEPADQVVGALYELSVKENATPMKDLLGFASEEDVKTTLMDDSAETDLVSMFKSEFEAAGIEFSDEEVEEMSNALQKLMQDAVKQYMAKIGEMEPAEEMTELTIKCQRVKVDVSGKEKIAWMPQDLSKFSDEVNNATFK